ncbi:MAG TPA: hypothetical protein VFT62_10955 [Mycobacteriales bacterium]|nr:hypothetical protein [Mycobacteriales bacterium]
MNDRMHLDDPMVAAVLAAAKAPAEAPLPGEAAALAAFREVHQPARRKRSMRARENVKLLAAAVFGGVVMVSGVATAAVGHVPLVHSNSHANSHATTSHQKSTDDGNDTTDDNTTQPSTTSSTDSNAHGVQVSGTAHETSVTGRNRGADVCQVASAGKCQPNAGTDTTAHGKSATAGDNSQGATKRSDAGTTNSQHATTHGSTTKGKSATAHTAGSTHRGTHGQAPTTP